MTDLIARPTLPPGPPALPARRLRELRRGFAPWRILDEPGVWPAGAGVDRELEAGAEAARAGRASIRLWRGAPSLVVTRREARLPRFTEARAALEADGWPVVVRDSGGTTVPHLPGALQVSLFLPRSRAAGLGIEDVYHLLCEPVRSALRCLGLRTGYGEVPGSFCDGRFNLVHGGRKVAGTAQRWKGGVPGSETAAGYILGHMVLFVEGELGEATEAVNRLLRLAGGEGRFDAGSLDTVEAALARKGATPGAERPGDAEVVPLVERVREVVRDVLERRMTGS